MHPDIDRIFTYHRPFGDQPARYEELRKMAMELASRISDLCPGSAEKTIAIRKLQ